MAETFDPPGRELVDALAALDRLECGDRIVRFWRQTVIDRAEALAKAFAPALRLARISERAARRGYVSFLYRDVGRFRSDRFRHAFSSAQSAGRLAGAPIRIDGDRVVLDEAELAFGGDGFDLSFGQMPKVAAFLDILHNTVGYAETSELLAPALAPGRPDPAAIADVERRLRNAFNAWLKPHLESQHRRNQAKLLQAHLAAEKRLAPDRIDDAAVLGVWAARAAHWRAEADAARADAARGANDVDERLARIAKAARDEGFRRYASAARLTFLYRRALERARIERNLETARSMDAEEPGERSLHDRLPVDQDDSGVEVWESPLAVLDAAPARAVKWMKGGQRRRLARFLGAGVGADQGDVEPDEALDAEDRAPTERPIEPEHWLTLLRLDVFGAAQERMTNALRSGAEPERALADCLASIGDDALEESVQVHRGLADEARTAALAMLAALLAAGRPDALLLLRRFLSEAAFMEAAQKTRAAMRSQFGVVGADGPPAANPAIAQLLDDPQLADLAKATKRAARAVNRAGFRPGDLDDPEIAAGARAGLDAFLRLLDACEDLERRMPEDALQGETPDERAVFEAVFRDLFAAM